MNNRLPDRLKCVKHLISLYENMQDICISIADVFELDAMHYYENLADVITDQNKKVYFDCSVRISELLTIRDIILDKLAKQNTNKECELEESN